MIVDSDNSWSSVISSAEPCFNQFGWFKQPSVLGEISLEGRHKILTPRR